MNNIEQCKYCGNNPIPHFTHWYFETLNILFTPFRRFLFYNPVSLVLGDLFGNTGLSGWFLSVLKALRLARLQANPAECKVRRAQVLWEEASKRGITMKQLVFLGKPLDCYIAEGDTEPGRLIFFGLPRPSKNKSRALDWMDDKQIFKKFLKDNHLPTPEGSSVASLRQALKIFGRISKPVIVKPRAGSRGRHSTTFVSTPEDLKKAFRVAKQLCYWVVVEEQLTGPVYRATVIDFKLCGVLRGDAPQVTGDGVNTIRELVALKNSKPHPGVKDIRLDKPAENFLARQNLSLDSVPKSGQAVALSEKIGVNYGGSSSEDFDSCHPDNQALFTEAARKLGDPIVGFDFIIPDITKTWRGQKCGFIEANSLPFINLHHDPLLGRPSNVAAKVWDMFKK